MFLIAVLKYIFFLKQVALEFGRLVSVDLKRAFFDGLDQHLPKLLQLYTKKGAEIPDLLNVMKCLDEEASQV